MNFDPHERAAIDAQHEQVPHDEAACLFCYWTWEAHAKRAIRLFRDGVISKERFDRATRAYDAYMVRAGEEFAKARREAAQQRKEQRADRRLERRLRRRLAIPPRLTRALGLR